MNDWRPWQYTLAGVLIGAILLGAIFLLVSQPRGTPLELEPLSSPPPLQVHVAGAVVSPGVYTLPPGSRVLAAVEAAGGLALDAASEAVNLAALLQDGMQIYIPHKSEERTSEIPLQPVGLVDLNKATLEELLTLPGIGPDRAQAILDYRDEHGRFKIIDEILDVPGIGEATLEQLKPLITVIP
jgi:competence protein ComEA